MCRCSFPGDVRTQRQEWHWNIGLERAGRMYAAVRTCPDQRRYCISHKSLRQEWYLIIVY